MIVMHLRQRDDKRGPGDKRASCCNIDPKKSLRCATMNLSKQLPPLRL